MNQTISRIMITTCKGLLVILPLYILLAWGFIDSSFMKEGIKDGVFFEPMFLPLGTEIVSFDQIQWSMISRIFGFLWQFLGTLPDLCTLWILLQVFKNYKKGLIFTIQNAKYYRTLGIFFLIDAFLIKPLSGMFLSLALTWGNEVGKRYIALGFGTPNLRTLFLSGVVILISWVMIEASKIQDEQELTV